MRIKFWVGRIHRRVFVWLDLHSEAFIVGQERRADRIGGGMMLTRSCSEEEKETMRLECMYISWTSARGVGGAQRGHRCVDSGTTVSG